VHKHFGTNLVTLAVVIALLAMAVPLGFACAGTPPRGKRYVVVGYLGDFTGTASAALVPMVYAIEDLARYINEEDPIPRIGLRTIAFDTKLDPRRDITGYNWSRDKGAELIITPLPTTAEALKETFAKADKVPVISLAATLPQIEPPGWVFCTNPPASYQAKALLKWVSEEHWDYEGTGRKPKIGTVGYTVPYDEEIYQGILEYCQARQDQLQWVGGFLMPMGTMTWSDEAEALRDCDYVCLPSIGEAAATFIKEFRDKGFMATFIGLDYVAIYQGLAVDECGWDYLDGMLTAHSTLWWDESAPLVDLAKDLLSRYHPLDNDYDSDVEEIMHTGSAYLSGFQQAYLFFDLVRAAVKEVGVKNFDGQSFYEVATGFQATYEGLPEWGFTEMRRYASRHVAIYEWSAEVEGLVRITDWLPVVD